MLQDVYHVYQHPVPGPGRLIPEIVGRPLQQDIGQGHPAQVRSPPPNEGRRVRPTLVQAPCAHRLPSHRDTLDGIMLLQNQARVILTLSWAVVAEQSRIQSEAEEFQFTFHNGLSWH